MGRVWGYPSNLKARKALQKGQSQKIGSPQISQNLEFWLIVTTHVQGHLQRVMVYGKQQLMAENSDRNFSAVHCKGERVRNADLDKLKVC